MEYFQKKMIHSLSTAIQCHHLLEEMFWKDIMLLYLLMGRQELEKHILYQDMAIKMKVKEVAMVLLDYQQMNYLPCNQKRIIIFIQLKSVTLKSTMKLLEIFQWIKINRLPCLLLKTPQRVLWFLNYQNSLFLQHQN